MVFSHGVIAAGHLGNFLYPPGQQKCVVWENYRWSHDCILYLTLYLHCENGKFPENTVFSFAVLKMEVRRCCLPWSVQCLAGDNPQGFGTKFCECVQQSFPFSHVYFYVVCFWIPLRRAFHPWTTRQSGALWGLEWVRNTERRRDTKTPRKSKRETEKRGGRQGKKGVLKDF